MGRKRVLDDLIVHESRGSSMKAWRRVPGTGFSSLRGPVLAHKLAGSELTLEALMPFELLGRRSYVAAGFSSWKLSGKPISGA